MLPFGVGDKVICVDAAIRHPELGLTTGLTKGAVYTIKALVPVPLQPDAISVELVEVDHGPFTWGFYADRFRPVKKTSIDVFLKILQDVPKTVTVE